MKLSDDPATGDEAKSAQKIHVWRLQLRPDRGRPKIIKDDNGQVLELPRDAEEEDAQRYAQPDFQLVARGYDKAGHLILDRFVDAPDDLDEVGDPDEPEKTAMVALAEANAALANANAAMLANAGQILVGMREAVEGIADVVRAAAGLEPLDDGEADNSQIDNRKQVLEAALTQILLKTGVIKQLPDAGEEHEAPAANGKA